MKEQRSMRKLRQFSPLGFRTRLLRSPLRVIIAPLRVIISPLGTVIVIKTRRYVLPASFPRKSISSPWICRWPDSPRIRNGTSLVVSSRGGIVRWPDSPIVVIQLTPIPARCSSRCSSRCSTRCSTRCSIVTSVVGEFMQWLSRIKCTLLSYCVLYHCLLSCLHFLSNSHLHLFRPSVR